MKIINSRLDAFGSAHKFTRALLAISGLMARSAVAAPGQAAPGWRNPSRVCPLFGSVPRVARSFRTGTTRNPWAGGRNPVGIGKTHITCARDGHAPAASQIVLIGTVVILLGLTIAPSARGQAVAEPFIQSTTQEGGENDVGQVKKEIAKVRMETENRQEEGEGQVQARERVQFNKAPGGGGGEGGGGRYVDRLQTIVRRAPGGGGKALVIRSSEGDAKEQGDLEEDLAVMSHILDKTVEENLGWQSQARTAMGIDVFFTPGGNPIRSLFLEGYGAVFMLKVGFPLIAPPAKDAAPKEEQAGNSSWEEAKRELYGPPGEEKILSRPAEEYDEDKVRRLKDTLLEALKNASNIRNLKADDSVTVCVVGGGNGGRFKAKAAARAWAGTNKGDDREVFTYHPSEGAAPVRGTIMTIRVKKSDAESFAKGKLNLDEFRKKAKIVSYAGIVGNEGGGFSFGFGNAFGGVSGEGN